MRDTDPAYSIDLSNRQVDVASVYAAFLRHSGHQHQREDAVSGCDWRPGQLACDQATAYRTYFGNIVASTARDLLAA